MLRSKFQPLLTDALSQHSRDSLVLAVRSVSCSHQYRSEAGSHTVDCIQTLIPGRPVTIPPNPHNFWTTQESLLVVFREPYLGLSHFEAWKDQSNDVLKILLQYLNSKWRPETCMNLFCIDCQSLHYQVLRNIAKFLSVGLNTLT